jgi:hypothetical protein
MMKNSQPLRRIQQGPAATIPDYSSGHAWSYGRFPDDQRPDQPRRDGHKRTAPGNAETLSGNLMLASIQSDNASAAAGQRCERAGAHVGENTHKLDTGCARQG